MWFCWVEIRLFLHASWLFYSPWRYVGIDEQPVSCLLEHETSSPFPLTCTTCWGVYFSATSHSVTIKWTYGCSFACGIAIMWSVGLDKEACSVLSLRDWGSQEHFEIQIHWVVISIASPTNSGKTLTPCLSFCRQNEFPSFCRGMVSEFLSGASV